MSTDVKTQDTCDAFGKSKSIIECVQNRIRMSISAQGWFSERGKKIKKVKNYLLQINIELESILLIFNIKVNKYGN